MSKLNNDPTLTDAQINLIDQLIVNELEFYDEHAGELPNATEMIDQFEAIQCELGTVTDSASAPTGEDPEGSVDPGEQR